MKSSTNTKKKTKKHVSSKKKKKLKKLRTPMKVIMQRKLAFTLSVIMLALFVMVVAAAVIGYKHQDEYSKKVLAQMGYDSQVIPYQRGKITDANGIVLATNKVTYNLILDPSIITSNETVIAGPTIKALAEVFGEREGFTESELSAVIYADRDATYIRYQKGLTEEERAAFEEYTDKINNNLEIKDWIKGVWFETEYVRVYPYGSTACDLIGFSSMGGSVGNYGLEQSYNDWLIGTNGKITGFLNQDRLSEVSVHEAVDGNTIVTTIDLKLQRILEENVQEFMDGTGAKNLAVIAMDPHTGQLLASVTAPTFDLNDPAADDFTFVMEDFLTAEEMATLSQEKAQELARSRALDALWKNYITTTAYEPGSTMKPITVASALEEAVVSRHSTFTCPGYYTVDGVDIQCHVFPDHHGTPDLKGAVVKSCNPALMQISERMGKALLSRYQEFWGFGAKTGIDLPYEEAGLLIDKDVMTNVDAATNAFGQNMNVTIVQMAAAYCSLINGGTYYQPYVVKQILNADGEIVKNVEPTVVKQTVSKTTSDFLKGAMRDVLLDSRYWYERSENGDFEEYPIGGKTGTAEKYPRGNGKYIVSLASFEPYDDPNLFIMIVIDEPDVEDQSSGGHTTLFANKLWHDVIEYRYDVELDEEEEPSQGAEDQEPSQGGENQEPSQGGENQETTEGVEEPSSEGVNENGGHLTDEGESP